jgi:hypothetical protein
VHEQLVNMEEAMRAHSERFGVDVGLQQIRMAGRVLNSPAVRYYYNYYYYCYCYQLCYANNTNRTAISTTTIGMLC